MKEKMTQQELVFYKLYTEYKKDPERYVQIWEFVGEIQIIELNRWELMSYTCVHRVFEVCRDNPDVFVRRKTRGKSGSTYYQYKIRKGANVDMLRDDKLVRLYNRITGKKVPTPTEKMLVENKQLIRDFDAAPTVGKTV